MEICWGAIPTGGRPTYSISEVPISRINHQGVVKRIRRMADFPTNLDGEEVEFVHQTTGHFQDSSPSQSPSQNFHSQVIPVLSQNSNPDSLLSPLLFPNIHPTHPPLGHLSFILRLGHP
ncbi:hypothetical protein O181_011271 [Austropuccinia psidii MF-1]|uniref:Uncharacterized protein n=1 Tax=Austropuccinia psidii MF-1 TaxID=1389203 RepID=A0A9Q3BSJ1_9BASI|nr:hypothetical protein [Austropuccinia psidii MF-1]